MSPKDAAKLMAEAYPGGLESLLPRIHPTKTLEVFQKELRGSPGFKLDLNEAALIAELCHEQGVQSASALATEFARRVGGHFKLGVKAVQPSAAEVMQDTVSMLREQADLLRVVTEAGLDGHYTANEVKRIEREADEAIAAIQRLVADVKAGHEAGKPSHLRAAS